GPLGMPTVLIHLQVPVLEQRVFKSLLLVRDPTVSLNDAFSFPADVVQVPGDSPHAACTARNLNHHFRDSPHRTGDLSDLRLGQRSPVTRPSAAKADDVQQGDGFSTTFNDELLHSRSPKRLGSR